MGQYGKRYPTFFSPGGWGGRCLLTAPLCGAPAAGLRQQLVEAELVSDAQVIAPGRTFQVGVLFRMAPGWHIYWKNPGDAGLATDIEFRLPKGFAVGALRWPAPHTFGQSGGIVGYGYKKQVLLWASVTASKKLRPGQSADLRVEASWLACRDKCVMGSKSLSLRLPVAAAGRPANRKLFAAWRRKLPTEPSDKASGVARSSVVGRIEADKAKGRFAITVSWATPIAKAQWYPAAGDNLEVGDVSIRSTGGQTVVAFTASSLAGVKLKSDLLESVLVGLDASGRRRAIRLNVPLRRPAPSTRKPSSVKQTAASRPSRCDEAKGAGNERQSKKN